MVDQVEVTPDVVIEDVTEMASDVEVDLLSSQGIKGPSEAELMGNEPDEVTEPEAKADDTKEEPETETKEEETEAKTTEEEPESTEKTTANSEPKDEEHPKGYVPLAALREAREENKYLKGQIEVYKSRPTEPTAEEQAVDKELEGFEVLTDEAFEDLAEDNPAQATIYLRKLNIHNERERQKADEARAEVEFQREYDSIIDASVEEIEKVVPGIFDEESEVKAELMTFAEDLGFTEDLFYLTNPSTKIILPGESEPLLLGEQAASILSVLVNAKSKTAASDTTDLETKLREDITKEVTAELMKKFKDENSDEYRGLSQVPVVDNEIPEDTSFTGKVLSTAEFEKLSPEQQEAYLAGY